MIRSDITCGLAVTLASTGRALAAGARARSIASMAAMVVRDMLSSSEGMGGNASHHPGARFQRACNPLSKSVGSRTPRYPTGV